MEEGKQTNWLHLLGWWIEDDLSNLEFPVIILLTALSFSSKWCIHQNDDRPIFFAVFLPLPYVDSYNFKLYTNSIISGVFCLFALWIYHIWYFIIIIWTIIIIGYDENQKINKFLMLNITSCYYYYIYSIISKHNKKSKVHGIVYTW